MRYIGGKGLLLDFIDRAIAENTQGVRTVMDIFAGSGIVSSHLKECGYNVVSNDILYFSYVLSRGTLPFGEKPSFECLGGIDAVDFLNRLRLEDTSFSQEQLFITNNYSPNAGCERMYFQPKNAIKIDIIRLKIEEWRKQELLSDDEYFYLLASLINAVPFVANITGVYAAYLKYWDIRTYNDIVLTHPDLIKNGSVSACYNKDYRDILPNINADLVYADPPYNKREYAPNYHILETIARYDYPQIKGVTGLRPTESKSPFCSPKTVFNAFLDLIEKSSSRYIAISYNNEGLMAPGALTDMCLNFAVPGTFRLIECPYRRYKNKIPNNKKGLKEQLYLFEKKNNVS